MNPSQINKNINFFSQFPYKKGRYKKKNWGHPIQSLCSYPSKLKPSIANVLIKKFTERNEKILDPFSGCGTIPFEACSEGRIGIGVDLNPFAYFLTFSKVNIPKRSDIENGIIELKKQIKEDRSLMDSFSVEDEIIEFYHNETLREILISKEFLLGNKKLPNNVNTFIWSAIAHILHGNRPYALSRRSHNIIPIPPKGPIKYKSLIKSLKEKINRCYSKPLNDSYIFGKSYNKCAFNLPFSDNEINTIITSPPFFGTTEFLRQNRIRLWFAGWDYKKQKKMKGNFLEAEKTLKPYYRLIKEFRRVLVDNGLIIFHLGVVKKVDMGKGIIPFAEKLGFSNLGLVYEDAKNLENHGRTDRGATHTHQFLFLLKN